MSPPFQPILVYSTGIPVLFAGFQWNLLKIMIENFNGWKFAHPCIVDFCNEVINAPDYKLSAQ